MFIARQAIFNRSMKVYGYELLYRDSKTAKGFNHASAVKSTATVLSGLFELGIDNISNSKKSFINFDYEFLFSDSIELIKPDNLIIEILENTPIDKQLINRIAVLKEKGYKIALDDFVENYDSFPLISLIDIIKYDLIETPLHSIEKEVSRALRDGKTLIAEKVETQEEYKAAKKMGFHLFQGYFFERPNIIGHTSSKKSPKLSYLELLNELNAEEPSFDELTDIIKTDVNLSRRLFLNTRKNKIDSDNFNNRIKQALVYMGFKQIRRWVNILMLRDLSSNKPDELTRLSLIRAHFGESLAQNSNLKARSSEIYGMFLFSILDALLDQPIEEALEGISPSEDAQQALVLNKGPLCPILQLVYSYEKGDWDNVGELSRKIKINKRKIGEYYLESIEYAKEIMNDQSKY